MLAVAFLFPMVLTAAGAAAAPVIIHLIMRTKPRKIVFPAMRFVRKTHRANLSKLRLKHLILLLMRMLAIVLLAALIARAEVPRWASVADTGVPAAAVVIVDNSASMGYVHQGQSVLARGKRLLREVLDALPAGSRVAVLPTQGAPGKVVLQADRNLVAAQLAAAEPTYGTRPVDYVEQLGWLREDVWFAHLVHLSPADIEKLSAAGVGMSHCPSSNMTLGSGIAPVAELMKTGVKVSLAVDGSAMLV